MAFIIILNTTSRSSNNIENIFKINCKKE